MRIVILRINTCSLTELHKLLEDYLPKCGSDITRLDVLNLMSQIEVAAMTDGGVSTKISISERINDLNIPFPI